MTNLRTCNKCGWVHFGVSRKYAESEVAQFNAFYDTLDQTTQNDFYGGTKSSLATYEKCWCGNPYANFRESKEGDCPDGCTLGPIIFEEKEEV